MAYLFLYRLSLAEMITDVCDKDFISHKNVFSLPSLARAEKYKSEEPSLKGNQHPFYTILIMLSLIFMLCVNVKSPLTWGIVHTIYY